MASTQPLTLLGSGRERDHNQVVLKIAHISDCEGKWFVGVPRLAWCVAVAVLAWQAVAKLNEDPSLLLRDNTYSAVCTPLAALCVSVILATLCLLCKRLLWSRANGWRWTVRQKAAVGLSTVSLCLQGIGASCFLVNVVYIWVRRCSWFDAPVDVMAGLQHLIISTLFLLNITQAAQLVPEAQWGPLLGDLRRCLFQRTQQLGPGPSHENAYGSSNAASSSSTTASRSQPGPQPPHPSVSVDTSNAPAAPLYVRLAIQAVPLAALLLLWVPIQVTIILLIHETVTYGAEDWNGWYCDDVDNPGCLPTGGWKCSDVHNPACWPTHESCREWDRDCKPETRSINITWAAGALMNVMAIVFLAVMWLALRQLGRHPYNDYRVQNLAARLALRTRVPTYILYTLNIVFCWYMRLGTCTSYLVIWVAMAPTQIAMTATVVVESLLFMPSKPDKQATMLHDSLQQFAWTEREVTPLVLRRGFPSEPCFCFETALKAAYMSLHVYYHFRPQDTVTSIPTALALFGALHIEYLREPKHDSNCLLVWGPRCLIITFRGTNSASNLVSDLKAWRTAHPPKRGSFWLGDMPLCHLGFVQSWVQDGFHTKVLGRIREILEGKGHIDMAPTKFTIDRCCSSNGSAAGGALAEEGGDGSVANPAAVKGEASFRILLAGHSLGGAMTHLCGIDLARALPDWGFKVSPAALPITEAAPVADPTVSLSTYTFGAPRTGNRAFAKDYEEKVPDSWSIINRQDAVANQGKFLVLFKRSGKVVLLSRRGDLIVRPSTIEHTAHRTLGTSLRQHMLAASYCPSLAAVLRAQLFRKPMPGGREALAHLGESQPMAELLGRLLNFAEGSSLGKPAGSPKKLDAMSSSELD